MHKKQDRILAILAAYRNPLVDPANFDEPFFYDAVRRRNHQIFGELVLIAFPCDKSVYHVEIHSSSLLRFYRLSPDMSYYRRLLSSNC